MHINDLYQKTLQFAAQAHGEQKVPDQPYSYLVHLCSVAREVMSLDLPGTFDPHNLMQAALLHDVLEDTPVTQEVLLDFAGAEVTAMVAALTKDSNLPKTERIADSLRRIKLAGPSCRIVKMADRIVNLQTPPASWSQDKCRAYLEEAQLIFTELSGVDASLDARFQEKLKKYAIFLEKPDWQA